MMRGGALALLVLAVLGAASAAAEDLWSLAYPPLTKGSTTPNQAAPLPEWTLWQVFKTQSACEEHRALWQMIVKAQDDESIKTAGRRAVFAQGIPPPSVDIDALEAAAQRWVRDTGTKLRQDQGMTNQVLVAQCVSAADPRLAPKTPR